MTRLNTVTDMDRHAWSPPSAASTGTSPGRLTGSAVWALRLAGSAALVNGAATQARDTAHGLQQSQRRRASPDHLGHLFPPQLRTRVANPDLKRRS
jgi:hypothetical protein